MDLVGTCSCISTSTRIDWGDPRRIWVCRFLLHHLDLDKKMETTVDFPRTFRSERQGTRIGVCLVRDLQKLSCIQEEKIHPISALAHLQVRVENV